MCEGFCLVQIKNISVRRFENLICARCAVSKVEFANGAQFRKLSLRTVRSFENLVCARCAVSKIEFAHGAQFQKLSLRMVRNM